MVDFLTICEARPKKDSIEIYPEFIVGYVKDLMIRGSDFYAFWDEELHTWVTSEQDLIEMVDNELRIYYEKNKAKYEMFNVSVKYMRISSSGMIDRWHKYVQRQMRDQYSPLNESLVFADQETVKSDYSSKKLPYAIAEGPIDNYEELVSTLYNPIERHKFEWAIGAILCGDSKWIQKYITFYGSPGSGKSTIINIFQMLFDGYYEVFDAEILGNSNASFALEQLKKNPLVAICHDTDLSHIEKNTTINSLVSHETMTVNEKHKSLYTMKFNCFVVLGSNKYVKITDSKSGGIRRLIDIHPSGNKIKFSRYNELLEGVKFELPGIAYHCLNVYKDDPYIYNDYIPVRMLSESNDFYNFILDSYMVFKREDQTTLTQAWEMYKEYVAEARVPYPMSQRAFKIELANYFKVHEERCTGPNGERLRNVYKGFKNELLDREQVANEEEPIQVQEHLDFGEYDSILNDYLKDMPAQYAKEDETPSKKWEQVTTTLKDLNPKRMHYVKLPLNLIQIDFDKKDANGNKSFELNEQAALKWPRTYSELSKSGGGIHAAYIYDGDPNQLIRTYNGDPDIEIKVFTGNSSLRRKLTKCTKDPIAHLPVGSLPLKEEKVVNFDSIKNEKALRTLIINNINKKYHSATKPSIDFIYKGLEDAYNSGMSYNVSDMYNGVLAFAAQSTNQSDYCVKLVTKMHFKSDDAPDNLADDDKPITFYDIEVFPNLLLVNYKEIGEGKPIVGLINPTPSEIEYMIKSYRLVGFNCRRYDNHIIWARMLGWDNNQLYKLSKAIIGEKKDCFFGEAYNISYTDIYDYCSAANKKSLKKWEIDLRIHHKELGLSWDEPVPEELWPKVSEYCDNDVLSTESVWWATQEDFRAREILADLAGMTLNDTTNSITTRIVFGKERNPQLVYTHLDTGEQEGPEDQINKSKYINAFPGYKFEKFYDDSIKKFVRRNMYRGTDVGLGGYVYAEPGMYENVALLDVASMHPHSILSMNCFGKYTRNYEDVVDTRIHIKHDEYDILGEMFGGKLKKYLTNPEGAAALSKAMKTPINAVYGLTSASFPNPFRDPRNENNIVALKGALFMRTLQDEVVARGFTVAHIKTDSIKIPNATPEIIQFCMEFARKYGYEFEHEATYKKMCLVNDAVYIGKYMTKEEAEKLYGYCPSDLKKHGGEWTATGTQFAVPYVFKYCFSHEPIEFYDLCEAKQVKSAMYLDYNEGLSENEHNYKFIGRVGLFCPVKEGKKGGMLVKEQLKRDGSVGMDSVTGCKGYRWEEAEDIMNEHREREIDMSYFDGLVNDAIDAINKFGDYNTFVDNK